MDGYVWRVPTELGVMACSALALFAAAVFASIITGRRRSIRATLIGGGFIVLIAMPTIFCRPVTASSDILNAAMVAGGRAASR